MAQTGCNHAGIILRTPSPASTKLRPNDGFQHPAFQATDQARSGAKLIDRRVEALESDSAASEAYDQADAGRPRNRRVDVNVFDSVERLAR